MVFSKKSSISSRTLFGLVFFSFSAISFQTLHSSSETSPLYHPKLEQAIVKSIAGLGEKTKLRDACEYALTSGGKRIRPLIVLFVAEALGNGLDVYDSALAIEYMHTASLIADDLPSMDNDDERRGKPSVHKVFGEATAILAILSLKAAAFEKVYLNTQAMKKYNEAFSLIADQACSMAVGFISKGSGILGASGGQFLDIFDNKRNLETTKEVIYKKTVTVFEIAFLLGWVFGGGDLSQLDEVKEMAYHFGMAFQIADDLGDVVQDEKVQRDANIVRVVGKEASLFLFEEEMRLYEEKLVSLNLNTPSFQKMSAVIRGLALSNASKL